jgi:hypothetical protein
LENFEIPPKIEILMFFKKLEANVQRRHQCICLPFRFSKQQFGRCLFYCQKMAFVCEFQHTPLWEIFFFSMFHTSCIPSSPRDKNKMMHHPCLLEKVVFWASKTLLFPIGTRKKAFFINFKLYDLANGRE